MLVGFCRLTRINDRPGLHVPAASTRPSQRMRAFEHQERLDATVPAGCPWTSATAPPRISTSLESGFPLAFPYQLHPANILRHSLPSSLPLHWPLFKRRATPAASCVGLRAPWCTSQCLLAVEAFAVLHAARALHGGMQPSRIQTENEVTPAWTSPSE